MGTEQLSGRPGSHYAVLGVRPDASAGEIRSAFRKLALVFNGKRYGIRIEGEGNHGWWRKRTGDSSRSTRLTKFCRIKRGERCMMQGSSIQSKTTKTKSRDLMSSFKKC
uniref:Uncharacterized protein LOC105047085 isoform X5 n=1 Tax=Elaeis guineensis var. tenera TaxID=51953 RepID=A0A8N4EXN8_ELAGV|nr:uncharacterized protein LOC105047085 isoform X5 [Elaeis guineensis]